MQRLVSKFDPAGDSPTRQLGIQVDVRDLYAPRQNDGDENAILATGCNPPRICANIKPAPKLPNHCTTEVNPHLGRAPTTGTLRTASVDLARAATVAIDRAFTPRAGVAELVDALVLGTSVERRGGSSPFARTIRRLRARRRSNRRD